MRVPGKVARGDAFASNRTGEIPPSGMIVGDAGNGSRHGSRHRRVPRRGRQQRLPVRRPIPRLCPTRLLGSERARAGNRPGYPTFIRLAVVDFLTSATRPWSHDPMCSSDLGCRPRGASRRACEVPVDGVFATHRFSPPKAPIRQRIKVFECVPPFSDTAVTVTPGVPLPVDLIIHSTVSGSE